MTKQHMFTPLSLAVPLRQMLLLGDVSPSTKKSRIYDITLGAFMSCFLAENLYVTPGTVFSTP